VALPVSIIADTPHLREKTAKLGFVGRACSIFSVREIILYHEDVGRGQAAEMEVCEQILSFIETPQYLRRKLFTLSPTLRFTGILPPLQSPHHSVPASISQCKIGDMRDGVVLTSTGGLVTADVGLSRPIECDGKSAPGERITTRITALGEKFRGELVDPLKTSIYWGYRVRRAPSLGKLLMSGSWDLRVGTSRYGDPLEEVLPALSKALKTSPSALVAFGSPKMGLREVLAQEGLNPKDVFQYFLNIAPDQQTVTIRTEEAILVSLGILNLAQRIAG